MYSSLSFLFPRYKLHRTLEQCGSKICQWGLFSCPLDLFLGQGMDRNGVEYNARYLKYTMSHDIGTRRTLVSVSLNSNILREYH